MNSKSNSSSSLHDNSDVRQTESITSIRQHIIEGMKNVKDFVNLMEFLNYVLSDCSNCISDVLIGDIEGSDLYKLSGKSFEDINLCKLINTNLGDIAKAKINDKDYRVLKTSLVLKIIKLFVEKGLLSKRNNTFYLLGSNKKLSWLNTKQLKLKDVESIPDGLKQEIFQIFGKKYDILVYIKALFWFFRKAVVDSIISDLINRRILKSVGAITAISVGSTSLTSDYDISIDATYKSSAYIIYNFGTFIEKIFNDNSESLFDTNIYGASFIKRDIEIPVETPTISLKNNINNMITNTFSNKHKCNPDLDEFSYIKNTKINTPQKIWAYIKTLLKLNTILKQDDKLYDKLYSKLENAMNENNYFKSAQLFVNKYESDIDNYKYIVNRVGEYLKNNIKIDDETYLISNFISFVNYNGSETYLTNGAFLDVVVNQQLCKNGESIKLDKVLYYISFIENISDLMTHYHKKKYRNRCMDALNNFLEKNINIFGENCKKYINDISEIQDKCEKNVLDCNSFKLMDKCIDCIIEISKMDDNGDIRETELFDSIIFPVDNKMDIEDELGQII
jgi:hypothetical protein